MYGKDFYGVLLIRKKKQKDQHVDACETQLAKWIRHSLENINMKQRKCKQ